MISSQDNSNFYGHLKPFTDFSDLFNPNHYVVMPQDWWILITDIKGSTKAIQDGKYKEVNMLGAACITCVLNTNSGIEIPYVFGGDGATLLIPDATINKTLDELGKLQNLALKSFAMDLRVGAVSLSTPALAKSSLKVAKYELSPGNYISQFRGQALTLAEDLVKSNSLEARILIPEGDATDANFNGLSCRISPVKSKNGEMLSLLCRATDSHPEKTMQEIIFEIRKIVNDDFQSVNPAGVDRLKWRWPHSTLSEEVHFQKGKKPYWLQFFISCMNTFVANHSLKLGFKLGSFLPTKYKSELVTNCDFKKYDETLRMVIDCSPKQIAKIEALLEDYARRSKIAYGLHRSTEALITCMVFSPTQNKHIHFIDGADGGYAFAAIAFKKALKK